MCVAALAVATAWLGVPAASAEIGMAALDALDAADKATRTAAATGIDVIQVVKLTSKSNLRDRFEPRVGVKVRAGSRIRVHETVAADKSFYISIRRQPSKRLLGAAGRESATAAAWATPAILTAASADTAHFNGATDHTAIVGLPEPLFLGDGRLEADPLDTAFRLILPPYSASYDEGWTTVSTTPQPDGTTLISGTIIEGVPASDGEEECAWPLVEIVVGPDSIARSSHWIEKCPNAGKAEFRATATYGPAVVVQPHITPTMSAKKALTETRA
jgi:hypothetical protein